MAPTLKVGDKIGEGGIPHGTFGTVLYSPELEDHSACGVPTKISTEAWADKKVVIFAVPGAFTPTCHVNHLPPYLQKYNEIKAKGVDLIVCIAANDPFVLSGWGRIEGVKEQVCFASDPDGRWSEKLGLGLDLSGKDLGKRTGRYVLILDKLEVKHLAVEPDPTQVQVSGAEHVLDALNKIA